MARWLTTVASVAVATLSLAGPGSAQPITAHSSTDDVLAGAFVGSVAEGQIGDGANNGDYELGIGQIVGAPLRSANFTWSSGTTYDWTLTFVRGSFGGSVVFTFDGVSNRMGTAVPFNSFLIRTAAALPGTSVSVTKLTIGGPPGGGGGSAAIFETANPSQEAKSSANGSSKPLDILKISNLSLTSGFTLTGKAKLVFAGVDPPPVGSQLGFQIYAAVSDPDDSDGDGVPDGQDNCPNIANASQDNHDNDLLGDACDNCPFATNPPGPNGKQPNEDGDVFGDACDNCPLTPVACKPVGGGTCKIDDGTNSDSDSWGDRCDNCPKTSNEDQADSDGNGKGDACGDNTIIWNTLPPGDPFGGSKIEGPPVGADGGPITTVDLVLDCGPQDVASANIGINLTNTTTTFLDFSGCTEPGSLNPPEQLCSFANLAELGATVSTASSVLGPNIVSVGSSQQVPNPPGLPAGMVMLQLQGAGTGGLICAANEQNVPLGVLRLQNFVVGTNPLSKTGYGNFDPPLNQLVGPGGSSIDNQQVVFQVNPPGDTKISLQLRPPTDIATGQADTSGLRYELSIVVDPLDGFQKVARIAFGLTASEPIAAGEMVFGQCAALNPIGGPVAGLGSLLGCAGPNADLGANVNTPTLLFTDEGGVPVNATYTVGPDASAALPAGSTRLPNTLYVALDSLFEPDPGTDFGLNGNGVSQVLGIVEFVGFEGPVDPPQITFQGTEELPGFEGGPVVSAVPGGFTADNVTLINTFSASNDTDKDGEPDDFDNCARVKNADQFNTGGVGFVTPSGDPTTLSKDEIGDACQCGDPGRDGVADNGSAADAGEEFDPQDDVVKCQAALAGQGLSPNESSDYCKVTASEGDFSIIDVLVLEADTAVPGSSGLGDPKTGSLQSCGAAEGS